MPVSPAPVGRTRRRQQPDTLYLVPAVPEVRGYIAGRAPGDGACVLRVLPGAGAPITLARVPGGMLYTEVNPETSFVEGPLYLTEAGAMETGFMVKVAGEPVCKLILCPDSGGLLMFPCTSNPLFECRFGRVGRAFGRPHTLVSGERSNLGDCVELRRDGRPLLHQWWCSDLRPTLARRAPAAVSPPAAAGRQSSGEVSRARWLERWLRLPGSQRIFLKTDDVIHLPRAADSGPVGLRVLSCLYSNRQTHVFVATVGRDGQDSNPGPFAVKVVQPGPGCNDGHTAQVWAAEVASLRAFDDPSVVRLHQADGRFRMMVMSYHRGEPLHMVYGKLRVGSGPWMRIAADVFGGLRNIHGNGRAHNDIKGGNIVNGLPANADAVIVDVGLADAAESGLKGGTAGYLPPEALDGENSHGRSRDMWALGVTLLLLGGWLDAQEFQCDAVLYDVNGIIHRRARDTHSMVASLELIRRARDRLARSLVDEDALGPTGDGVVVGHNHSLGARVVCTLLHEDPADRPSAEYMYRMLECHATTRRPLGGLAFIYYNAAATDTVRGPDDVEISVGVMLKATEEAPVPPLQQLHV